MSVSPQGEPEVIDERIRELYEEALKKKHEDLAMEHAQLVYILENAVPELKDWILGIGKRLRIFKRNWEPLEGYLIGFQAEITKLRLDVTEMVRLWDRNVDRLERKVVEIPTGSITMVEWVEFQQEFPREEQQQNQGTV
jgi:hypothetical protein